MSPLLETLAAGLERSRPITTQVARHISEAHAVTRENIGGFLSEELPKLEDYEVDLVLAPLFTPTLQDQAPVAELLGKTSIALSQWPELVQQLVRRPTIAPLVTEDGAAQAVPLREVTIERFVHRLRLDGTMADEVCELIDNLPQASDRAWLKAIARRAIWDRPDRCEILARYLKATRAAFHREDAAALLKLVETYEPANIPELLAQIPHWQQVLRQEINAPGGKPFFNERVEELHGGGRDQRRPDDRRVTAQLAEQAFLERLQQTLTGAGLG